MSQRKLEFSRGEIIAEKYEVVDLLDESPLGLTYRAKHNKSGKYVRITMLRPAIAGHEHKEGILNAFKAAKELDHPNLLKVGELGEHEGVAYYTAEDFEGQTLRELLQEYKVSGKQFEVKEAAQVTIQILEGLRSLHQQGKFLRAVRPEYILINVRRTGPRKQNFVATTKIVGAGFWSLVPSAMLAEDEFTRGEAQYLAPELKSFEPRASQKVDVYSAGVIFYEMLVGAAPVGTFQLPRTRRPDLPEHVNNVVELALAHSPEDRYPSSEDFTNDIQRIFDTAAMQAGNHATVLTPLVGIALIMALVSVGAVAVILFWMKPDPIKQAKALDAQLRKDVAEKTIIPSQAEVTAILQSHPKNMLYIPAGPYLAGRMHLDFEGRASEPLAEERVVDAFLIDAFEQPNLKNGQPKYDVTYKEAEAACESQGKRLCSADEWEKACKGRANTIYSYGDTFDESFCGLGLDEQAYFSGSKPECKSTWGVFDMSGNFREWTASAPPGKDKRRLVKGGLKSNPEKGTRCAFSTDESISFKDKSMSYRCCRDVDAAPLTDDQKAAIDGKAPEEGEGTE